jgi:formylmethanofuran dehydrogenase subunit E
MSRYYSDNPLSDFHRYDADIEREREKLPKCSECDNPIQDEHCYLINDEPICEDCLKSHYRKRTESLTG